MKRILKGAIASLLFFGVVQAGTHHDKTFLMPRSHNDNLAMQYTTGHKQVYKKGIEEDHFGGTLQLAPFYQRSTNTKALGNYFGTFYEYPYNSTPTFQELQDFIGVEYLADGYMPGTVPLNPLVLIHSHGHGTNPGAISNALRFRPYQESIGLRVDYNQKLDKLIPGLYLQIEAPLVYVKQSLGETLTSAATTQYLIGDNGVDDPTRSAVSLVDYLSGNVTNTATASSHGHEQEALTYAKINGSHNEFGLADVDLKLGYNFLYEDKKHVAIYTALTIPTGNKPDGRYVFEPMVGNGGHWAVGGGIDLSLELWKDENKSIQMGVIVDYKYLWSSTEKRTLGYTFSVGLPPVPFGHYYLAGEQGKLALFPFANVLTRDVCVTPGSQVDALVNFAFNWNNCSIDCGYELYAREKESVTVKYWPDNKYAVAAYGYNTATRAGGFNVGDDNLADVGDRYLYLAGTYSDIINKDHLCTEVAETPAQVTHKLYASFGHTFAEWKYPVFLGLGSSYEFNTGSNSALQAYSFWGKAGLSF